MIIPPSGWRVLRVDAVLTKQSVEPLDLGGELPGLLGQVRRCRVRGGPQLLSRGLVGQQFRLPEAQRDGLVEVLGIDGRLLLGAGDLDLLIQVTGVGPDPDPLLNGRQLPFDGRQLLLDYHEANVESRPGPFSRAPVQQLDDLLAHPVQVGA